MPGSPATAGDGDALPGLLVALPRLQGDRVKLRPFGLGDITEAYIGWLNDPETVRFSNQRFVRHTRETSEHYLASFSGGPNLFASIHLTDASDGRDTAVGTLTAYRQPHHGTSDIGILIGDRRVWGQGIGLDAFSTLCHWLAAQPGMRKITCGTLACNTGMVKLAKRAGMQLEAVRERHELVDGQATDLLYFARFI